MGLSLVAISQGWQRERVRALFERTLSAQLGHGVHIASLEGPLYPELRLGGFRIGPAEDPLLALDRAVLRLDASRLLSAGALSFETVAIDGAHYRLERASDGSWTGLGLDAEPSPDPAPSGDSLAWLQRVELRQVTLRDGRLSLRGLDADSGRTLDARIELSASRIALPFELSSDPSARMQLRFEPGPLLGGRELERGDIALELSDGRLSVVEGTLGGSFGEIEAEGGTDLNGWLDPDRPGTGELSLVFHHVDPAAFGAITGDLNGRARLEARLPANAPASHAELQGTVDVEGSELAGWALARATLQATYVRGAWSLEEGAIEGEGLSVQASGRGDLETFTRLEVRGFAGELRALPLASAYAADLGGEVEIRLELRGPVLRPEGKGQLRWSQPRIASLALATLAADFETRNDTLQIEAHARDESREIVRVEAAIPYDELELSPSRVLSSPRTRLDLHGEAVDLALLEPLLPDGLRALRGRARLDLALRGGPVLSGEGSLDIADGSLRLTALDRTFAPVTASLRFTPHRDGIEVTSLELELEQASLGARGVVGAKRFHNLELTLRDLDAAFVVSLLPNATELAGRIQGGLHLNGDFANPRAEGTLSWDAPRIAGIAFERAVAEVSNEAGTAHARLRVQESGREVVSLVATAPLGIGHEPKSFAELLANPATRLDLRAENFALAALSPLVPRGLRDLQGRVDLALQIRGASPEPQIEGSVELADASVAIPLLHQTFAPIRGQLEFDGERVELREFEIGTAEAGARLSGHHELEGLKPTALDLTLALNHFPLARSPLITTDATGSLRVDGTFDAPRLAGELALENTNLALREEDDPAFKEIRVVAAASDADERFVETSPEPDVFERSAVDFRLSVPRNTWVRGQGAALDVEGDLELHKRPFEAPVLVGNANVVRGYYTFQRKRFDVRRGSTTFDGATEIDPVLDIEAAHRVRDVTVLLYVTGRLSSPTLRLASEPPHTESDVLSYLFFGRPADQLAAGEDSNLQAAGAAFAAGVAASQAATLLAGAVPLVDTFDIEISETGAPSKVEVGGYLTERAFLRYGRTIGPESVDQVSVELRLTPHWSIESDVASDENAGLDVIWSADY